MVSLANRVRTSLAIGAAGAAVIAALLMTPRTACPVAPPDGMLSARLISTRILTGARDQDVAVTITAPTSHRVERPAMSVAIVIDRSGSMNGVPIQNAKAAAAKLVDQLADGDAFSVVTFSSTAEVVVPMTHATAAGKATARAAIDRIWDDGGTCTSCGLERGEAELGRAPGQGVRRIVLLSDGQANVGVYDRTELVGLVAGIAARGTSVSAVGIGLDFDEVTMTRIADVGHGHYYFVEDTANLQAMFAAELGGLAQTVATHVRLVVTPAPGVQVTEIYGTPADGNVIPIADLQSGETRKVVLHLVVPADHVGPLAIAGFALEARRVADGRPLEASTELATDVVDDAGAVAASVESPVVRLVEEARSAAALEEATVIYDQKGAAAAQQVLHRHAAALRVDRYLDAASRGALEQAEHDAEAGFAAAPTGGEAGTRAKKVARERAYKLAH